MPALPAAFGRLCVETRVIRADRPKGRPAAFGRLCVETIHLVNFLFKIYQPPSGGCVLKQKSGNAVTALQVPAAFGRLCVETRISRLLTRWFKGQPPSGGCVLKRQVKNACFKPLSQPPSGGCVLKLGTAECRQLTTFQPPSGGCVLKRTDSLLNRSVNMPAAFGRLCVETTLLYSM